MACSVATPLDICIRGGGLVGHTLALLLARERLRVGLVTSTAAEHPAALTDVRAYAMNHASKALLESVRCWPADPAATPVLQMQVQGDQGGELRFDATAQGVPALAWIVDAAVLTRQLSDAVRYAPQIQTLSEPVPATLTVVCEGRVSATRAELGVEFDSTPYPQHALAARVQCEQPHGGVARQWFAPGEVLAFLPMAGEHGNSVALVWSVSPERAQALLQAETSEFCQQLVVASQASLGRLSLSSERAVWPLQKAMAQRWTGRSALGAWALAGDAAHTVHPLAGQGLNLGLADAALLAHLIHGRDSWRGVDDAQMLRRYERSRKAGVWPMASATDGMQWLFAQGGGAWRGLRNWGMRGVQHSGPLKTWMAQQAMDF